MASVIQAETVNKPTVVVVLRSGTTPGKTYQMIEDRAARRFLHIPEEAGECDEVNSSGFCWHEDRLTHAAYRMRPVWRRMLAAGCPSAAALEISETRRAELIRATERRLAAADGMVAG